MTAKDFLGNEIKEGDYFAYPLTVGRSASMAVFKYVGRNASGTYKALPVKRSYGGDGFTKYKFFVWNEETKDGHWRDMTPAERAKVDAKTSTLHLLEERAVKLKGYKE